MKPGSVLEVYLVPNAPGESSANGVLLARTTYTGVSSVAAEGKRVQVALDADAYAAENRYLVRVDGNYLMESWSGTAYYASKSVSGNVVTISSEAENLHPGSVVEVFLAPNHPGDSSAGGRLLTTFTVS